MSAKKTAARRRPPLQRGLLRDHARTADTYLRAHRKPRARTRGFRRGLVLRVAGTVLLLVVAAVLVEQGGRRVAAAVGDATAAIARAAAPPVVVERGARPPAAAEAIVAAPILDPLDPFTRESRLVVSGRLPSYVLVGGDRPRVEIVVNGTVAASPATDEKGRFSATVALQQGPNLVTAASLRSGDRAEAVARRVVLDTVPPPLTVSQPADASSVDGPTLRVAGQTESGATVAVNGHAASVTGDGSFEDLLQVQPGPLAIEVVARDQAGNETRKKVSVTVRDAAPAAGSLNVVVQLDRATAQPGQTVVADVAVADRGTLAKDATVSVSVGLNVVATGRTDLLGRLHVTFTAPSSEGIVQIIAIASTDSATGRAATPLEVKKP